jgi:hypothetical protein
MDTAERAKILDRLSAGEITVSEAMRLIDGSAQPEPVEALKHEEQRMADEIPVEEWKAAEKQPGVLKIEMPEEGVILQQPSGEGGEARWVKIRVTDRRTGQKNVSITLPIGFVTFCLGIAKRFNPDMKDVDTEALMAMFKAKERGMLVEVNDEEDDKQVLIYMD